MVQKTRKNVRAKKGGMIQTLNTALVPFGLVALHKSAQNKRGKFLTLRLKNKARRIRKTIKNTLKRKGKK